MFQELNLLLPSGNSVGSSVQWEIALSKGPNWVGTLLPKDENRFSSENIVFSPILEYWVKAKFSHA